jgi:glycine hydroxymethyltransferase
MLEALLEELSCQEYHQGQFNILKEADPQVAELIAREYERLASTLQLIAAENRCSRAVLAALGSVVQNKTTEGFPGVRFHGGCEVVDDIERLAASRAKEAFGAQYANVQPHSGTAANQIVLTAVLEKGDKILSLGLDQGGHLSHGAKVSFSGKFFDVEHYYVDRQTFLLDYDAIGAKAERVRPKLIICGATAYSRTIDFKKFRQIADRVGAYLLADISHISALVMAGVHPSPIDHAHFTTTSTYKPGGSRGGLILMGKDFGHSVKTGTGQMPLFAHIERTTFPGVQGTPYLNNVAAKAVFFKEVLSDEYKNRQSRVIENAKRLAQNLADADYNVLTGGTDNHMILVDVANFREGLTGVVAQKCLEDCGIVIDKNKLPYDKRPASIARGIRLGTPIVTKNGMGVKEMDEIAGMIDAVLKAVEIVSQTAYKIAEPFKREIRNQVKELCRRFPIH